MRKNIFLLVLLFFVGYVVFSQETFSPGYIITLNGDTVKGQIKNPKKELQLFWKINFQVSEYNKKSYTPEKLIEYNINGVSYVP